MRSLLFLWKAAVKEKLVMLPMLIGQLEGGGPGVVTIYQ